MADDHDPAGTEESRFRGAPDDLIIIPFVVAALVAIKTLRFILSMLMRLLDYAFPFAIQIVWLPLFLVRVLCNAIVAALLGALRVLPVSETRRARWGLTIRRNWSRLRRRISYGAFERAVHVAFEDGMAWVFRKCRHLTPGTALLVILGAVLWLPISFVAATALHAILLSKVASWPAWTQLFHAVATVIAKSKLLVLPAYPAAWPQAKKHPLVRFVFRSYEALKRTYVMGKLAVRYSQARIIGLSAIEALERVVGVGPAVTWLRNAHLVEQLGVERPTQKLRSFFSRWSIKFSAEYYEAKDARLSDS